MLCALTHAQCTDFPCGTIYPFLLFSLSLFLCISLNSLLFMIREIATLLLSLLFVTLVTWTFPLVSGTFPLLHMSRSSSPTPQQVPAAGAAVSTVSLKLPSFWPADPELWFAQVDAQFHTKKITSQSTKFEHVIASLSPQYATEVRDLILKPPATNLYDKLREELVKRT